jgi:hypothetical protein
MIVYEFIAKWALPSSAAVVGFSTDFFNAYPVDLVKGCVLLSSSL